MYASTLLRHHLVDWEGEFTLFWAIYCDELLGWVNYVGKLNLENNISFSLLSLQISGKFDKVFDVADISVYVRFGSKI